MFEGESRLDVGLQSRLIAFDDENIIAPGIDHLLGHIPLAKHGVTDHHFPSERKEPQHFQSGLVFVGFGVHANLGEHGFNGRSIRGNEMLAGHITVSTAAQGFTIDRDVLERVGRDAVSNPSRDDGFELWCVEAA